ncbi:MAG: MBL fold metallo-hydrolase [Muribaculaceae bacterium]|nr:MBL fold metallo-hydrolase [Muribaculaceae bacterium]
MKLTFLGTGTSTGVPMIGCECATCRSHDRRDKRLRTSALLSTGNTNILIDAGPDFRQQILDAGSPSLSALLLTHTHYDHAGGIDDLRPYCYPDGFDIYAQAADIDDLRKKVPYCFAEHPYPGAPVLKPHVIAPMKPFEIDGLSIEPLPVKHYLLDIVGFKIGNLAYITDAKEVPAETIDAIKGVDTLVINALRHKEHISHLNLTQALDVIKAVRPRMAYLTHISHDMGLYSEVAPTLPDNVRPATDGETIEIQD